MWMVGASCGSLANRGSILDRVIDWMAGAMNGAAGDRAFERDHASVILGAEPRALRARVARGAVRWPALGPCIRWTWGLCASFLFAVSLAQAQSLDNGTGPSPIPFISGSGVGDLGVGRPRFEADGFVDALMFERGSAEPLDVPLGYQGGVWPGAGEVESETMARSSGSSGDAELERRFQSEQFSSEQLEALGQVFETGYLNGEINLREAALWYERATDAGRAEAAVRLGWLWLQAATESAETVDRRDSQIEGQASRDVEGQDPVVEATRRAEYWFARAARLDHAPGKTALASLWIIETLSARPSGFPDDTATMLQHEGSASSGGRSAIDGTNRVETVLRLLREAVEAGDANAAVLLARLRLEGLAGVPADPVAGAAAAEAGAQLGVPLLQGWLAQLHVEGLGVSRDPVRAYAWAMLAAAEGDTLGLALRSQLAETLSATERREAIEMASGWLMHAASQGRLPLGLRDSMPMAR
ncbi:MAG: tetratricopeptide repeat protein [Thioalkalivibrionaceae bacterium]